MRAGVQNRWRTVLVRDMHAGVKGGGMEVRAIGVSLFREEVWDAARALIYASGSTMSGRTKPVTDTKSVGPAQP